MAKKIVWLLLSCFMILVLAVGSCGPGEVAEEGVAEEEEGVVVEEVVVPQYGGVLNVCPMGGGESPPGWDPAATVWSVEKFVTPIYEKPMIGDIDGAGPRGRNEFHFGFEDAVPVGVAIPHLVESWDLTDDAIIFYVREGIHFQDKPPVNGRELDAEDVALSLRRIWEVPRFKTGYWSFVNSIEATDKYTVEIKTNSFNCQWKWMLGIGYYTDIVPRELVEQELINKWESACGTGPFILTDYNNGVAATYEANPDYWGKTTIEGKEYQLPFVDELRLYIMPDPVAFKAALHTGKLDLIQFKLSWLDANDVMSTTPEIEFTTFPDLLANCLHFRTDIPPTDDIRVRKALMYAIDYQDILDKILEGHGEKWNSLVPLGWSRAQYTPFEELPEDVQMYFGHYPEEAKKLLAEAGYPNGFVIDFMLPSYPTTQDTCSLIAAYWEEIGVTTNLNVMERTALDSSFYKKDHDPALIVLRCGPPINEMNTRIVPGGAWNISCWEDPVFSDMMDSAYRERDDTKRDAIIKEANLYWLQEATEIRMPQPHVWKFWWPWVENYWGESSVGYHCLGPVFSRIWIDQDLKAEMGY